MDNSELGVQLFTVGELFVMTAGEYSDYGMLVICRVTQDFDAEQLRREYVALPESRDHDSYHFVKWLLIDKRVAEELTVREWHIGNWSRLAFTVQQLDKYEQP